MSKETQAKSAPQTDQDDTDDLSFSEKQMEFLHKFVNSAMTGRFREYDMKQEKRHNELMERLSAESSKESPKKGKDKEESEVEHPELVKMKKKMEEYEKEREARRAKDLAAAKNKTLQETLNKLGVPSNKIKFAQAYLEHNGLIEQEDEETLHYRNGEEKTDLKSGLKKWLNTEEGKEFKPARDIRGSGEIKMPGANFGNSAEVDNDPVAALFKAVQPD